MLGEIWTKLQKRYELRNKVLRKSETSLWTQSIFLGRLMVEYLGDDVDSDIEQMHTILSQIHWYRLFIVIALEEKYGIDNPKVKHLIQMINQL